MTSLLQARRRAEEFAAAVDGGDSGRTGGEEIAHLLQLVETLRDQPRVEPRPQFAGDLRTRLMAEAETVLKPETANLLLPARERGRRERRLVAAASAFVLVGGTATMAAASQTSLPGDALYPIKRGIERAEAGLSLSEAGKGRDLLSHASHRLAEVEGLIDAGSVQSRPRVPETLAEFSASATEGSALLLRAFSRTGDADAIVTVRLFASDAIATLEELAGDVPGDVQGDLSAAAILLQEIDTEAASLCGGCAADLPVVEVPDIFLARAEVDRALDRAAGADLENSHPVVVRKGVVPAAKSSAGKPSAGKPSPAPVSAPGSPVAGTPAPEDDTVADDTPSPLPSPKPWKQLQPPLLPGLEGEQAVTDDQTVTEELTGVVETLLPDPNPDTSLLD